jgi:hypothetical protein
VPQEQLQQAGQGVAEAARRQSAAEMAAGIASVNSGELPPSAEKYIREVVEDNVNSGPGKPGRGFLGRLFAGEKVPGLSEGSNGRLMQQALLTAGLAMLGASPNTTFGQALAGGILMGRRQVTETAGELLDEERRQQRLLSRYGVLSNTDLSELQRWKEIRRRSMAEGDVDAAEAAQDVIQDLKDRAAGEGERKFQVVNGQGVWIDQEAGKVFDMTGQEIQQAPQPRQERPKPIQRKQVLPDGREVSFLADPFTGQPIPGSETVTGRPGAAGEKMDPEKAQVASELRREVGNIRSILGDDPETEEVEGAERFGATGSFGRFARLLPAELEPSDLKQMRAASENILSLIVRQRSGAQATDAEVERLKSFAIPKAGDDPETVRTKLERLEAMIADFQQNGANSAVDPIMQGGSDVDSIIDETFGGGGN